MKKIIVLISLAILGLSTANAQVGIGTTDPDASAALDIEATDKGFLPPRLTTAERDAIASPAEGLTIYNTDDNCLNVYVGLGWRNLCAQVGPTDVINPETGQIWMDRNLGANQVATASDDAAAYGDLYQWGRAADGHEDRTSNTTPGPVAAGSEGSNFITVSFSPFDWLSTPDDDRWNGNETAGGAVAKTANDPCPAGYRVPTEAELDAERQSWSSQDAAGAFASPLKLPVAGDRSSSTGALGNVGSGGRYWSSTVSGTGARTLSFSSSNANMFTGTRAFGFSVRCLKD